MCKRLLIRDCIYQLVVTYIIEGRVHHGQKKVKIPINQQFLAYSKKKEKVNNGFHQMLCKIKIELYEGIPTKYCSWAIDKNRQNNCLSLPNLCNRTARLYFAREPYFQLGYS